MALSFNIQYDPKKYEPIVQGLRDIYKYAPDPAGFEASYMTANIIAESFPHINKKQAFYDSPKLIEAYTGYKLDTQGFLKEFGKTFQAQREDLKISMMFSRAMMATDEEERKRRLEEANEYMQGKLLYRNDFKDMSIFTDLLVSSGKLLPSMLPTIGMHLVGAALAPITGGLSVKAATVGGALYSGMMEAGGLVKELYNLTDENGNRLGDEYIRTAWTMAMAGVGGLNLFTQGFEKLTGSLIPKLFGKKSIKNAVQSGLVANWAAKRLAGYAGNIFTESLEEATEELISMLASNYVTTHSNETYETLFEGHSPEQIIKAMAQTAVETAKGMLLTALPGQTISAVRDYYASDNHIKREANKYSEFTDDSIAVETKFIKPHSASKPEAKFEKFESPIDVVDVDGTFVPVNIEDSSKVKSAIMSGARALNVRVVNNKMDTATIDTETSSGKALNIASRTEGSKYVDNMVVFDTIETAQKEAKKYATKADGLSTFETQPDGSVLVGTMDGERSSAVIFTSKDLVGDGKTVYEPTLDQKLDIEDEFEKTRPDRFQQRLVPVRKQFQTYKKALQSKGATEEDIQYLNDNVLEQLYRTVKEKSPDIGDDQAYGMAIPSTYFAYLAAKVAGMSPQEFFETHFTPEKFAVITHEQEQEYLASAEGQQSIEIEGGLQAKQEGAVPVLGGLVWKDKTSGKKTIGIASGYTPLTVVHEIGHVLVDVIKDTPIFEPFKALYKHELEQDGGTIGRHFQERFASDLELYIKEGKTADKALRSVFSKIVEAIKSFVKYVAQDLDEPTRKAFDDLFDLSKQQEPTSTVESGRAIETSLQSDRKATAMPPQSDRSATVEPQQELFDNMPEYQTIPEEAPVANIEPQQVDTPVQLDLFGDPDEVADSLAQIATQAQSMDAMTRESRIQMLGKLASLEEASKIATSQKWNTGRELKEAIQDKVLEMADSVGIDLTTDSPATREYLCEVGKRDILSALESNKNAVGWYDLKTRQALAVMSLIHPEIATDIHARFAFVWATAVTSNGLRVNKNFELAEQVYATYKKTGKMPSDIGIGTAKNDINEKLELFNTLKDAWGIEDLMKFMLTEFTVKDIGSIMPDRKPSGEYADVVVKGSSILGPKVGNGFFSNLFGDFSRLTMDRWLVATWGRWTGTLIKLNQNLIEKARTRLSSVIEKALADPAEAKRLGDLIGVEITPDVDIDTVTVAVRKASTDKDIRSQLNASEVGSNLRLAGNSLQTYLDGHKLAPENPAERKFIRAVINDIVTDLTSTEEYKYLTIADVQAVLWYAEKRLYEVAKTDIETEKDIEGYVDDEAPDYANAAMQVAREKGISERRMRNALKREEDGRTARIRLGSQREIGEGEEGGTASGSTGQQGEARGFTEKEKRSFLQEQTIINARANRKSDEGSPWSYERGSGGDGGGVRLLKPLGVTYVNEWKALTKKGRAFSTNFFTTPNFYELEPTTDNATVFQRLISENKATLKYGSAVMTYEVDDYQQMRLFLTEDGTSGVAIKKDGDIVSVFSTGGNGRALMELAVSAGGRKLDCFDTILPQYYAPHGFRAVARIKWDDSQAPVDWNKETFKRYNNGEPDVVFMVYDPSKMDAFYSNKDGKLFKGNPETAYNNAVRLQTKELNTFIGTIEEKFADIEYKPIGSVIQDYNLNVEKNKGSSLWFEPQAIGNDWWWHTKLILGHDKNGKQLKLDRGPINITLEAIHHIVTDHYTDGVKQDHIDQIPRQLADPVMIVESDSTIDNHKGWPIFVTDIMVDTPYEGKQLLVIPVRRFDKTGNNIRTMYPWLPSKHGGLTLDEYMERNTLIAVNTKKIEQLASGYIRHRDIGDLQQATPYRIILDLSTTVNQNEVEEFLGSLETAPKEPDQTLASIEYRVGLQGLKEQLRNGEYPADRDLERFKGDPDVDWEIQFRKISYQDPAIIEMVSDAYDRLQKEIQNLEEGKTINENDRLIQIIDEMVPEEMRIDIGEEAGDVNRFLDRVKQQLKYKSYKQSNKEFDAMLSDNQYVLDVAKRLTDGIDRSKDSDISAYIFRLADHPNPSPYAFRMAKSAIRNDLAKYRRMLLRKEGNDAQISYEDATFVNEITEMPSRYENDEVRTLLSGNTDPVIKSIIRRGLATENTLNHVIDTMTADIEAFKEEFGLQELTIEALMKMLDEADSDYKRRNLMYLRLQEINKKYHDRYAKLKKSVKIRTDALKAKAAMERLLRKGDRLTTPTPNYDANIMHELNGFWKIMKTNDGGVKKPLNHLFKQYGISYENMHNGLKQFFEEREDGIYFKKKMNRMSMTDLRVLENIIRAIKGKARGVVNEMKDARNDRVLETVQKFLASSMNIDPGTFEEMIPQLKEAKGRSIVNDGSRSKGTVMGTINTQFLTMSRLIDQIDPSGALREWVFGRAGVDKILADEIRMQNDRYEKGKSMMESLGIKMADLNKEFHRFPRIGRGGQEIITYDMAVGLYVYEKQPDAKAKLLSPDGNGYTQEELDYIIDNLPENYKKWGDYLIKDMMSRHGAIADVYYRVKNKRLGFIANYFPLVRGVDEAKFEDMLEEEHYERNQNPADQFTYKRTGGTYPLALNATNVWHRLVHKQEHYISAAQWVNDTQYMLGKGGGDLFGAIEMTKGHEYAKAFQDFVNRFANRYHVYDTADVISNHIRSNLVIARLGFNIITAFKQIPSLFYFTAKFGPIRLIEALGQVLFHYKETSQKIYELSPQLKNRKFSHDYELVTQMQGKSRYERAVQKIGKVGMAPIQLMDRLVVNTLWLGAYNANIARNMSPEEAALDATRFIGDTQPGGSVIDTAAIYSTDNSLVKYLLMFSSQLNKNFNMIWADIPMALKQKHFGKAISYMLGLGMSFAGIMLASGTFAGDDDDDESIINQFFAQLANQIPVVGNAVSAIVSGDYFASDDALIIPEVNSLIRAYASGDQQRILDKWAKLGLSVGEVSGLPSGMGLKMYNTGFKDDEINLGYLLNSKWAELL